MEPRALFNNLHYYSQSRKFPLIQDYNVIRWLTKTAWNFTLQLLNMTLGDGQICVGSMTVVYCAVPSTEEA